ncbi:MAG TPA: D-glycerate dehydrogenase [Prolixibacteraceae bacterium]|nr:D-glycerate dehydrogenase [Prolixibacteraceae bacterium]
MKNREIKILMTREFPSIGIDLLKKEGFSVTEWRAERPMTWQEMVDEAKKHQALFCTLTDRIDARFLNECRHLDIVSQFGVGYDNINIAEATRLGIPVGNTPGVLSEATADIAFGLMIATSRKMFWLHQSILRGDWKYFTPNAHLGISLAGKTLGIFGLGRIGYEMAKRCRGAYNMDIIYCNRHRNLKAETDFGARLVSFDELLKQSDVLSVHCALTDETNGLFNRDAFVKMKKSAIFINTARGAVHNEADLTEALQNGEIWGAGLDVTNPEPMGMDNHLLKMENVCVLPHVGSGNEETRGKMSILAAENIIGFYRDGKVPHLVNPEALGQ